VNDFSVILPFPKLVIFIIGIFYSNNYLKQKADKGGVPVQQIVSMGKSDWTW
jgi:hypothetical protein